MIDSTLDLSFSDHNGVKVVGTYTAEADGNGLLNKDAKDIIIPERYQGRKVAIVGKSAFRKTNITSVFFSRYIKTIQWASFWECSFLKYMTFDVYSELENFEYDIFGFTSIESVNIPSSLKSYQKANNVFACNYMLKCVSYLGKTNLNLTRFLYESNESLVAHTLPQYEYKIGTYDATKDSQRCPEKIFPIQLKRRNNVCTKNRKQDTFLLKLAFLLVII